MIRPYLRRRSRENSYWYMGHLSSALVTGDDTGGALALFDVTIRAGMEPPAHVHSREEEAIFVLDGRIDGWSGNTRLSAGPGELVNLPNQKPHGWKLTPGSDGQTGRGLVLVVPGAMEAFFRRFSEPAPTLTLPDVHENAYAAKMQESLPQMIADAAEFGIQWMPPDYVPALRDTPNEAHPCLDVLGERFRPLAVSAETAGAFTAFEWTSPAQSILPYHLHREADEVFYVLEGEIAITAGEDFAVVAQPGDCVFLPKGMPHTHRATGGRPSRAFQILTPGGVETALAEVAALSPEEVTPERLAIIAERGGVQLLPG